MKVSKYKLNKFLNLVRKGSFSENQTPSSPVSGLTRSKTDNNTYKHTKNEGAAVWKLVYSNGKIIRNAAVLALPTSPNLLIPPN